MKSVRRATPADLPAVRAVVSAAYAGYLDRMDRPPAPMLADYAAEVEAGRLWVTGEPVTGLIELAEAGDSLHVANVAPRTATGACTWKRTCVREQGAGAPSAARRRTRPR
jgi:hypothetical protein